MISANTAIRGMTATTIKRRLLGHRSSLFAFLIFACLQDIIFNLSASAATKSFCYPPVLQEQPGARGK
jgi:hypothetical protein